MLKAGLNKLVIDTKINTYNSQEKQLSTKHNTTKIEQQDHNYCLVIRIHLMLFQQYITFASIYKKISSSLKRYPPQPLWVLNLPIVSHPLMLQNGLSQHPPHNCANPWRFPCGTWAPKAKNCRHLWKNKDIAILLIFFTYVSKTYAVSNHLRYIYRLMALLFLILTLSTRISSQPARESWYTS